MPVEQIEKTIDNHDIKIVQFTGGRGFKIKARLLKLLLPVAGPLFGSAVAANPTGSVLDADIDLEKVLPKALVALSESLDEDRLYRLVLDLLSGTFIDNIAVDQKSFDTLFTANYALIYKLMYEVIIANHFFDFGGIGDMMKKVQGQSQQTNAVPPENSDHF